MAVYFLFENLDTAIKNAKSNADGNEKAKDLYSVGVIDKAIFDRFNSDSLDYSPHQIVSLKKLGLTQAVFEAYLNLSDKVLGTRQGKTNRGNA